MKGFEKIIKHPLFKRAMYTLAIINLYGYATKKKFNCLLSFVAVVMVTHYFIRKSIPLALLVGLFISSFVLGCGKILEGLQQKTKKGTLIPPENNLTVVEASSEYWGPHHINFPKEAVLSGRGEGDKKTFTLNGVLKYNFWLAKTRTGYFIIDMQKNRKIVDFDIQNTTNRQYKDRGTKEYKIQISNDKQSWRDVVSGTLLAEQNTIQSCPNFIPKKGRYIKFNVTSGGGERKNSSAGLSYLGIYEEGTNFISPPSLISRLDKSEGGKPLTGRSQNNFFKGHVKQVVDKDSCKQHIENAINELCPDCQPGKP